MMMCTHCNNVWLLIIRDDPCTVSATYHAVGAMCSHYLWAGTVEEAGRQHGACPCCESLSHALIVHVQQALKTPQVEAIAA